MKIEHAKWIDWRHRPDAWPVKRVYFGHETCATLLPPLTRVTDFVRAAKDNGVALSLVTPFLWNSHFDRTCRLIEGILALDIQCEVICSDWGLLGYLSRSRCCECVVGRLLAGQVTDPRLARLFEAADGQSASRLVTHSDGTVCRLMKKQPSVELMNHYRGCHLDRHETIRHLMSMGVHRCEVNNVVQGLAFAGAVGWSYSLHVPEVIVSVMRRCPGTGEDLRVRKECPCEPVNAVPWDCAGLPIGIFRRENALCYKWPHLPPNLKDLPVDRIVERDFGTAT